MKTGALPIRPMAICVIEYNTNSILFSVLFVQYLSDRVVGMYIFRCVTSLVLPTAFLPYPPNRCIQLVCSYVNNNDELGPY